MNYISYCKRFVATILFGIVAALSIVADGYYLIVVQQNITECWQIDSIGCIALNTDSMVITSDTKRTAISVYSIDYIAFSDEITDTLYIHWEQDETRVLNPLKSMGVDAIVQDCHVRIIDKGNDAINICMSGESDNGSLYIASNNSVHLQSIGLTLKNFNGEAINVQSKQPTLFDCLGKTIVIDSKTRDDSDSTLCKSCFYTQGNLIIKGSDSLFVTGNYKNAIQSSKSITTDANIIISSAVGSGLKAKKKMVVEGGSINFENVGNNSIDVEKGNFVIYDGDIKFCLTNPDTKGIKADSLYVQYGGSMSLNLLADQCKGIKTKKGIHLMGGTLNGVALGDVVITDGDPSYCTFLKCDSDIILNNTHVELLHSGDGGKCISADGDVKCTNTALYATLTGDGGWYCNDKGEDDYYTPRAIEADDSLTILSGNIDIHCTGIGGKGMVCDHDLTIGELGGDNDKLHICITTEGTSIVNDTVADYRKGCPKAMKSLDQLDILSGNINIKTCGMGGEGLESKNELYIVGGNVVLDTFDDGVNGEKSINVHGGTVYCCSQDNDGFDSNGCINIFGGTIYSISLHPKNESFDTEGNTLNIYGGTLFGIGGGTVYPAISYIPFYSYPKWTSEIIQSLMPKIELPKGNVLAVTQGEKVITSGKIPANMNAAIVTIASNALRVEQDYNVVVTDTINNGEEFADGLFMVGGTLNNDSDNTLKFSFKPKYYF